MDIADLTVEHSAIRAVDRPKRRKLFGLVWESLYAYP